MKKLYGLVTVLIAIATLANAESVRTWHAEDAAPVFRVKNSGTEKVDMCVAATTFTLTITNGSCVTTKTIDESTTVADIAAAVEASTNSESKRVLSVDYDCSLATDIWSNEVVTGTTTIQANQHNYVDGPKWDTSACLYFSAFYPGSDKGGVGDVKAVARVFGDVGGTGNITLRGYADGTEIYQRSIVSPQYVFGPGGVTNTASDEVGTGIIDFTIDLPIAQTEGVMFRATRATTATTGGLGLVLDLVNK
jgi:hypothetical protein